jgi:hypothetical protein
VEGVSYSLDEQRRIIALDQATRVQNGTDSYAKVLKAAREFEAYLKGNDGAQT